MQTPRIRIHYLQRGKKDGKSSGEQIPQVTFITRQPDTSDGVIRKRHDIWSTIMCENGKVGGLSVMMI